MKPRASQGDSQFGRILVATDGSENAKRAVRIAIDLAKRYDADLIAVNAIPTPTSLIRTTNQAFPQTSVAIGEYYKHSRAEASRIVEDAVALAKGNGIKARGVVLDSPISVVESITRYAEKEKVDLIVAGTRGLSGFRKLLVGSVSRGLVNHAPCSVLVVR